MEGARDSGRALTAQIADFDHAGSWALALLVARRVDPGRGQARSRDTQEPRRFDRNVYRRLSAGEFARRCGTSTARVMAFYAAWQRAAQHGVVPPAEDLVPGTEVDLPDETRVPFFGAHGYFRRDRARPVAAEPGRPDAAGA